MACHMRPTLGLISSPSLDVYLYDNGVSFPPLEFGLETVLDPPMTTSSLVAPSSPSTFRNSTVFIITLLDPFNSVDGVSVRDL